MTNHPNRKKQLTRCCDEIVAGTHTGEDGTQYGACQKCGRGYILASPSRYIRSPTAALHSKQPS